MVKLSRALRSMGRADEAVAIGQQMLVLKPDDRDALMEAGRANIAAGQAFYAVAPLEKARKLDLKDWRPVSLLGVAYEAVQRDADAAAAFAEAVRLAPDNPGALSNLAMFKAGRGQTAEAETLLRRAAASPDATAEVRLNLGPGARHEGRPGRSRDPAAPRPAAGPGLRQPRLSEVRGQHGDAAQLERPAGLQRGPDARPGLGSRRMPQPLTPW